MVLIGALDRLCARNGVMICRVREEVNDSSDSRLLMPRLPRAFLELRNEMSKDLEVKNLRSSFAQELTEISD